MLKTRTSSLVLLFLSQISLSLGASLLPGEGGLRRLQADSNQSVSAGGWAALIILLALALILLMACLYHSRRLEEEEQIHYVVQRCHGCRRAFRIPTSIGVDDFMCTRCISEGRRRLSDVEDEERAERMERMNNAPAKKLTLKKLTSTFFKVKRQESSVERLEREQSKAVADNLDKSMEGGEECKICYADQASIVLLPCGHGGLCEGCAKDLIHQRKECHICRGTIDLIAQVKRRGQVTRGQSEEMPFDARIIAPSALHHLESRPESFPPGNGGSVVSTPQQQALPPWREEADLEAAENSLDRTLSQHRPSQDPEATLPPLDPLSEERGRQLATAEASASSSSPPVVPPLAVPVGPAQGVTA